MSNDGSGKKNPNCTRKKKKRALEGSIYYTSISIIIIEWRVPVLSFRFCKREVLSRHWFTQTSHVQLSGNSYIIVCILYIYIIPKVTSSLWVQTSWTQTTQHSRGFSPHLFGICSCDWKCKMIFPPWMCFKGPRASSPRRWSIVALWWFDRVTQELTGQVWNVAWNLRKMQLDQNDYPHTQGTGCELFSIALLKHRCMRCIYWSYKNLQ